jgi:hypothetical protein
VTEIVVGCWVVVDLGYSDVRIFEMIVHPACLNENFGVLVSYLRHQKFTRPYHDVGNI